MADSYKSVVGGKLKLKRPGGGGSSSAAASATAAAPQRGAAAQMAGDRLAGAKRRAPEDGVAGASSSSAAAAAPPAVVALTDTPIETIKAHPDGRTPAQRAHDEALAKRRKELAGKMASKSHREKVEAMNEYLSKIPEHNDIPKISYAGTG